MYSDSREFLRQCPGAQAVDFFLAVQLTATLGHAGDALLFHSIAGVSTALRDGHTCLLLDGWAGGRQWSATEAGVDASAGGYQFPPVEAWASHLASLGLDDDGAYPLVFENRRLYLRRYWQFEEELAGAVNRRCRDAVTVDEVRARQLLDALFGSDGGATPAGDRQRQGSLWEEPEPPVDWARVAVANALGRCFSIIAGGPGTGKTTTVTRLLAALIALSERAPVIKMAAPTGKAAQRLTESVQGARLRLEQAGVLPAAILAAIPAEACTLHRLLGVVPNRSAYRYHEDNPLALDILLVDEVSMVDLPMMARLFRALPERARVIFLGDAAQLPSVAAGSVLANLVPARHVGYSPEAAANLARLTGYRIPEAGKVAADYLTVLRKSYRFTDSGGIGKLARQVITGDGEGSWHHLVPGDGEASVVSGRDFDDWLSRTAAEHYGPVFSADSVEQAFAALNRFRILAATRVGPKGVDAINRQVEGCLRSLGHVVSRDPYYKGRPLMVTENHYGLRLFNGDVGLMWERDGKLRAAFPDADGGIRWFAAGQLPRVDTVYAMTIHKTQGSEYDRVAMVMPDQYNPVLTRELVYTGITRARNCIEVWGGKAMWLRGVSQKVARYSGLDLKIRALGKSPS